MSEPSIFRRIKDLLSPRPVARNVRKNPVFEASVSKASDIYAAIPLRDFVDDRTKKILSRRLYLELHEICSADEPKAVCREKIARAMLEFAPLQVLMIPPPPSDDVSGLRDLPGITGELKSRLDELLKRGVFFRSETDEKLLADDTQAGLAALRRSYWETYWFLEAFNATRIELGDTLGTADWYRPFLHAACVNQEHLYRRELNLPAAFDEDIAQAVVTAFSIYTDVVVSGADDPDREWREYCAATGVPTITERGDPVRPSS